MKRRHITGFYIETLVLIAAFVAVVLILTQIFGLSRNRSREAKLLTTAVALAENAAEAIAASESPDEAFQLLNTVNNAQYDASTGIQASYDTDMTPSSDGSLRLTASWEPEETGSGTLVTSHIEVWDNEREKSLYSIETAVFLQEVTP